MKTLFFGLLGMAATPFAIPSLGAQTQTPSSEVRGISCFAVGAFEGWSLTFRSDGSASVAGGATVNLGGYTEPAVFNLTSVYDLIKPVLKGPRTSQSKAAVGVFKEGQTMAVTTYVDEWGPLQALLRQVIENATFADLNSFREAMEKKPPFGLKDIIVSDSQDASRLRTIHDSVSNPSGVPSRNPLSQKIATSQLGQPQTSGDLTGSDRLQESQNGAATAAIRTRKEPPSSTPWSLIVVLIVAVCGLLWLLLKRRSGNSGSVVKV